MKKIIILGSTGSIGKQTLEIIKRDKKKFKIEEGKHGYHGDGSSCDKVHQ